MLDKAWEPCANRGSSGRGKALPRAREAAWLSRAARGTPAGGSARYSTLVLAQENTYTCTHHNSLLPVRSLASWQTPATSSEKWLLQEMQWHAEGGGIVVHEAASYQ